jgi:hypothetical protein
MKNIALRKSDLLVHITLEKTHDAYSDSLKTGW